MVRPASALFVVAAICSLLMVLGTVAAATACPNAEVRAEQGAADLPDCRAYELVNPPSLDIGDVVRTFGVADDGERATWVTLLPGAEARGNQFGANAVAVRAESGWQSTDANLELGDGGVAEGGSGRTELRAHSRDFSRFILGTTIAPDPRDRNGGQDLYLLQAGTGEASWVSYGEVLPDGRGGAAVWVGGSPDLTRNVFTVPFGELIAGKHLELGLYARDASGFEVVSVLPDGSLPQVATVASSAYDFGLGSSTPLAFLPAPHGGRHAVSDDATRIFFYDGDGQLGPAPLYERDTKAGVTTAVSASQRSGDLGVVDDARFIAASHDGNVSFFESSSQLTDAAPPGGGIYRFQLSNGNLELVTPEVGVPSGLELAQAFLSEDSSQLYFSSPRALLPGAAEGAFNLYLWRHGAGIRLVASAPSGELVRISRNGRFAVIESASAIDGSPNEGNRAIFEYDEATDSVACASCRADGSPSEANSYIYDVPSALLPPWYLSPRAISDDGELFFTSIDRIVPADRTPAADVYEYSSGHVSLLSSGRGGDDSYFADNSDDGKNVFILSRTPFDARDRDANELDLYDVRVDGGFPTPAAVTTVPCAGDDCQGPQALAPRAPTIGSVAAAGVRLGGPAGPHVLATRATRGPSARLWVRAPGRGTLALRGDGLEPTSREVPKSGTYRLRAILTAAARSALARMGTLAITATVLYRPAAGPGGRTSVRLMFKSPSTVRRR